MINGHEKFSDAPELEWWLQKVVV